MCAGRQSAPCVASHVTLGSVSLTASGSRGENTIAVSHTTSHWAALQVWAGGWMREEERKHLQVTASIRK